jgi:hypothetical protein
MNKQINELIDRSGFGSYAEITDTYIVHKNDLAEFAELIVKDCIEEIEFQYGGGNLMEDGETHNPEWDNAIECVSAMVRKHFRIEE